MQMCQGANGYFRHESGMGHAIGSSTTADHVHRQQMRQAKDVVYGLLSLLHDLADLRFTNPILRTPTPDNFCVLT